MNYLKVSFTIICLTLFMSLCGCGASRTKPTLTIYTTNYGTYIREVTLNVPYPEPLVFKLPQTKWIPLKSGVVDSTVSFVVLGEGDPNSYVKLRIEGQAKAIFEGLEKESGIDFIQSDSLILVGLLDCYKTRTQKQNAEKSIEYGPIKFERQEGDTYAWIVTSNDSYSVAYAVLKTKNSNYFTFEVDQKTRWDNIENLLMDVVRSRKQY